MVPTGPSGSLIMRGWLETSNETPCYRSPKMAAQNACFPCAEVDFMQAECMIDALGEKALLSLEFWPEYLLYQKEKWHLEEDIQYFSVRSSCCIGTNL